MMTGSLSEVVPPATPSYYQQNSNNNKSSSNNSWWPYNRAETRSTKRGRASSCNSTVSKWSNEDNKLFEDALAKFDKDIPDRWEKVAALVPGKSVQQVLEHYRELEEDVSQIEAGCVPCSPEFDIEYDDSSPSSSSFLLMDEYEYEYDQNCGSLNLKQGYYSSAGRKRGGVKGSNSVDHERKKGIPWTEDEHRLFLLGLQKYGKGDWRSISRNFVVTRTSTQVASHAQKYFIRLNSPGKDKRRSSIHDITTVNLPTDTSPSTAPLSVSGQFLASVSPNIQPNELPKVFSSSFSIKSDQFMQKQQQQMLALRSENDVPTSSKFTHNYHPPWFFV